MLNTPRQRKVATWVAGAVAVGALTALPAMSQDDVEIEAAGVCSFLDAVGTLSQWQCVTEDGTVTTTTQPPDTTIPPTTTMTPPTTTTEPPTTTTTEPPIGSDPSPVEGSSRYDIYVIGNFGSPDGTKMWEAPYYRELTSNAGWDDGDRTGYRFAYGFLHHDPVGSAPDRTVFRFAFAGGYGGTIATQIGDQSMNEAERFYDCTRYDVGGNGADDARGCGIVVGAPTAELRDSPSPAWIGSTDMPPDRRPVIRVIYIPTGEVVEKRQYTDPVNADAGTTFGVLEHITADFQDSGAPPNPNKPDAYDSGPHTVYERFVVGSWLDGDNAVSVYYDVLNPNYRLDITFPLED